MEITESIRNIEVRMEMVEVLFPAFTLNEVSWQRAMASAFRWGWPLWSSSRPIDSLPSDLSWRLLVQAIFTSAVKESSQMDLGKIRSRVACWCFQNEKDLGLLFTEG